MVLRGATSPRVERAQPFGVEVQGGLEEPLLLAVEDHPGVDELAPLDSRDDAQQGVLEGARQGPPS
jgi:hypothetical protein